MFLTFFLTRVFKGVRDKNQCDCLLYIPDLAEKGIRCRQNPEAATVLGVLQKKAYNFILKRLHYCEIFRSIYFEKHLWTTVSKNQHQIFRRKVSFLTF